VPLTKDAQAILENQRAISRSNFVFVRYGERVKKELWYKVSVSRHTVSEQFSNRRDQLGLPWDAVLHSTRHTALTDLGAAGAGVFTIKQVAGHASVTTSERYVHPVLKVIQRAIENLEKYRGQDAEKRRSMEISDSGRSPATISATVEKTESRYGVN
jgi:integrase